TAPTFRLKITGDGFDRTFTQNNDFNSFILNLKSDTNYEFVFTVNDRGGVRNASLTYSRDYIDVTSPLPSTWSENSGSPLTNNLVWSGNRSDPYRIAQYAGTFRTSGDLVGSSIDIEAIDFGGSSGLAGNSTNARLRIYIANGQATEIVPQ
ncbi:MAG: hypothetical protein AAF466_05340, partial [Bacteroidota bacterium]